jgi:hypothetical protein
MNIEIKNLTCWDQVDVDNWTPTSPKDVYLHIGIGVGIVGEEGEHYFSITVTTPQAIAGRPSLRDAKLLVVQTFNWSEVRAKLARIVASCERPTWDESVSCLRVQFDWEYEGMSPHESPKTRVHPNRRQ